MPPSPKEIRTRQLRLAGFLAQEGLDAALIRAPLHIYYLSGTFVDGHLVLTTQAKAYLLVYRTIARAQEEAQAVEVLPFRSLKALPGFLGDLGLRHLGLEGDRLPLNDFKRYERLLKDFVLSDISALLWRCRAEKTPYEIECLRKAGVMLAEALEEFWPRLRPGMTELEAAALLEGALRRRGHPAYTRVARWTQELAYGHLLFGPSAAVPAYTTTGQGGPGVTGFAQGPGFRKLAPQDLIVVDYAGWWEGYMVDQTRLFALQDPPQDISTRYQRLKDLLHSLEETLRPGVLAEEIYFLAQEQAQRLGLSDCFMAHGPERVPFVGHGVGLEIDEWPALAPGVKVPLKPGMVIALEPKCHLPGQGEVGLEDTYLITPSGAERLTVSPRKIRLLGA